MPTYRLRKWSVSYAGTPYDSPESIRISLRGYRNREKKPVLTSYIVKAEGRKITTYSGSIYILWDIDPDFLQWMKDNNIPYNEQAPITLKESKVS